MATPKKTDTAAEPAAPAAPSTTGFVPKVKKLITLPLIKPKIDEPVYVKILEPMMIGKQIGEKDAAILCNVVDLTTGETAQIIIPSVVQGIFHDSYGAPKYGTKGKGQPVEQLEPPREGQEPDSYVGRGFQFTKHQKASGKAYNPYTVAELEL